LSRHNCGRQVLHSEATPLPPLSDYRGAYDVFKRVSEEVLTAACEVCHSGY